MRLLRTFCIKNRKKVNKLFGLLKIIITFADVNCFYIYINQSNTYETYVF